MNATLSTPYKIYFKVVYTCKTATYLFNPAITIRTFIVLAIRKARADFAINPNDNVEIVETGQHNNVNGIDAEKAPALALSYATLEETFGGRSIAPSFYVRIIPRT